MPKSQTHNEIVLRPPPGTRFTIFGSDVHLEFQRGREKEIVEWLHHWIDAYIVPEIAHEHMMREQQQARQNFPKQTQQQIFPVCIRCKNIFNPLVNTRCALGDFCTVTETPKVDGNPNKITAEDIIAKISNSPKLPINLEEIKKIANAEFGKMTTQSNSNNEVNSENEGKENHG